MTTPTTPTQFHSDPSSPLVVNFGGGVDSTALLVGLVRLYQAGDDSARPALVIFADTGDEIPETYANVARVSSWLTRQGFPGVTTVSRPLTLNVKVPDLSLSDNCLRNQTLPSEAFGCGACASKWKHEPMDRFLQGYKRPVRAGWLELNGYAAGTKPTRLVGYDATETQSGKRAANAKRTSDDLNQFRYPLVEWNWSRAECVAAIEGAGLPVPHKSACYMCPNQKPEELRELAATSPELLLRALSVEEVARRGRNGLRTVEGLWRRTRKVDGRPGSWVEWATANGLRADAERRTETTLESLVALALGTAVELAEAAA